MAKRCSNCGTVLSDLAERCPECGARHTSTGGPYRKEHQKSPGLAAFLSVLIVGLGQVYNGQVEKGVIFFIFFYISAFVVWYSFFLFFGFAFLRYMIIVTIWSYAVYDAHKTAEWNNYYYSKGYR